MSNPGDRASEEARRDLERLKREGETLGGTAMDAATPRPEAEDDAIEKLGRKIGRGLAFVVLPFAILYFGRTAGWW
ncbi:MAG: hypothetical protein ACRCTI_01615 [Beijerinckiaceae bacterium]